MSYKKLPNDYAIDALSLEAQRRERKLGRPYSYGQLIADTSQEEREGIAEGYREQFRNGKRGEKSAFLETERDAVEDIRRKQEQANHTGE